MARVTYKDASRYENGCVDVQFEEGIAWVYLNRPAQKNALSPQLNTCMANILERLEADERCGVLVLGGRGEMFSMGLDLGAYYRESHGLSAARLEQLRRSALSWQRHLMYFRKPTIAMVHGGCHDAAFMPVICCDIALAAEDATFGLAEINHGAIPAGYIIKALSMKVCQANALYYIMTGSSFNGEEAAAMGLVNIAVQRQTLRVRTRQLARLLLSKNLTAVTASKIAYKHAREMHWDAVEDYLHAKAVQVMLLDVPSRAITNHRPGSPRPNGKHNGAGEEQYKATFVGSRVHPSEVKRQHLRSRTRVGRPPRRLTLVGRTASERERPPLSEEL